MLIIIRICRCRERETIRIDDEEPHPDVIDGFAVIKVRYQCDKCFNKMKKRLQQKTEEGANG